MLLILWCVMKIFQAQNIKAYGFDKVPFRAQNQPEKPKQKFNKRNAFMSATLGAAATGFTPLIYKNGFKEYKNRNPIKMSAGMGLTAAMGVGISYLADKFNFMEDVEEENTNFKSYIAIGAALITSAIALDYLAAKDKNPLKMKLKEYSKKIKDDILDIIDDIF